MKNEREYLFDDLTPLDVTLWVVRMIYYLMQVVQWFWYWLIKKKPADRQVLQTAI